MQVDVFAEAAYEGNPLAVFPDAPDLTRGQMQAIAKEMNLSETTFVLSHSVDEYKVRIFTPAEELPFAGHPTIGTAWALKKLGLVKGDEVVQHSAGGATPVTWEGDVLSFERGGEVDADLEQSQPDVTGAIAALVGLPEAAIGLEAREFGRPGRLRPAYANAGVPQLMIPVKDLDALVACQPNPGKLADIKGDGAYCFTATGAGKARARGFFPGLGITEDPATGSAAAALGLYLADRIGSIQLEILQGLEIGRPSLLRLEAEPGRARVGGRCVLSLKGSLERLP